jgi:hypothetical protein
MKIDDNGTVRNMTKEELAEHEAFVERFAEKEKAEAEKVVARNAILAKLGLTADELAALFS